MPRSDRMTGATHHKLVLLLAVVVVVGSAAISVVVAAGVDSFSYPALNATTTQDFVAVSNIEYSMPATPLFDKDRQSAEFNRSEGFLLLRRTVDVWRAGPGGGGGAPALEASFNTSFVLTAGATAAPVAFVLLRDYSPPLLGEGGLRGFPDDNYSASDALIGGAPRNASGSLGSVEAGPVRSYGPDSPTVGLNVTVTPNGTAVAARAVWIKYDAAKHRLSVYVARAGEARPAQALLDAPLVLAGERTNETALVGFFASAIKDILVGVRECNLTVDRLDIPPGGHGWKKGASSSVILLLAVIGSVAAMACVTAA